MKNKTPKCNKIYCGADISGIVKSFTVFKNGILPENLKQEAEKCPAILSLITDISEIGRMRKAILQDGSKESILYNITKNYSRRN